jgi:hypothetical protein
VKRHTDGDLGLGGRWAGAAGKPAALEPPTSPIVQRACQGLNPALMVRAHATRLGAARDWQKFVSSSKAPHHHHPHLRRPNPRVVQTNCAGELRNAGERTVQTPREAERTLERRLSVFLGATSIARPRCAHARIVPARARSGREARRAPGTLRARAAADAAGKAARVRERPSAGKNGHTSALAGHLSPAPGRSLPARADCLSAGPQPAPSAHARPSDASSRDAARERGAAACGASWL